MTDDIESTVNSKLEEYGGTTQPVTDLTSQYSSLLLNQMNLPQIPGIPVSEVMSAINSGISVPSLPGIDISTIIRSIVERLRSQAISFVPNMQFSRSDLPEWPDSAPTKISTLISKDFF